VKENNFKNVKLFGIISDTHDNIYMIDAAIHRMNELGVELVIHAGDYISPFVVKRFKHLKAKMIGVFGNNCAERLKLTTLFSAIGAEVQEFFSEFMVCDLKIALLHGHDKKLLSSSIKSGTYDLVIHGHTHQIKIEKKRHTTVINPGEVCGYLSGKSTLIVYNVETREVTQILLHRIPLLTSMKS